MLTELPNDYSLALFDVVLGSLGAELNGGDVVRAEAVEKKNSRCKTDYRVAG